MQGGPSEEGCSIQKVVELGIGREVGLSYPPFVSIHESAYINGQPLSPSPNPQSPPPIEPSILNDKEVLMLRGEYYQGIDAIVVDTQVLAVLFRAVAAA